MLQCIGMLPFLNSSEHLIISCCSHKNFMTICQIVQELSRRQTNRHTSGHYWKHTTSLHYRCMGSNNLCRMTAKLHTSSKMISTRGPVMITCSCGLNFPIHGVFWPRDVQKTEILFGFGLKNQTVQKFDIGSDSFPTETACNPPFK